MAFVYHAMFARAKKPASVTSPKSSPATATPSLQMQAAGHERATEYTFQGKTKFCSKKEFEAISPRPVLYDRPKKFFSQGNIDYISGMVEAFYAAEASGGDSKPASTFKLDDQMLDDQIIKFDGKFYDMIGEGFKKDEFDHNEHGELVKKLQDNRLSPPILAVDSPDVIPILEIAASLGATSWEDFRKDVLKIACTNADIVAKPFWQATKGKSKKTSSVPAIAHASAADTATASPTNHANPDSPSVLYHTPTSSTSSPPAGIPPEIWNKVLLTSAKKELKCAYNVLHKTEQMNRYDSFSVNISLRRNAFLTPRCITKCIGC
jgi:hypothetical protein